MAPTLWNVLTVFYTRITYCKLPEELLSPSLLLTVILSTTNCALIPPLHRPDYSIYHRSSCMNRSPFVGPAVEKTGVAALFVGWHLMWYQTVWLFFGPQGPRGNLIDHASGHRPHFDISSVDISVASFDVLLLKRLIFCCTPFPGGF